jgi:hypothetical protein
MASREGLVVMANIVASNFQWHKKFGTLRHQRRKESISAAAKQKVYRKLTCAGLKTGSGLLKP